MALVTVACARRQKSWQAWPCSMTTGEGWIGISQLWVYISSCFVCLVMHCVLHILLQLAFWLGKMVTHTNTSSAADSHTAVNIHRAVDWLNNLIVHLLPLSQPLPCLLHSAPLCSGALRDMPIGRSGCVVSLNITLARCTCLGSQSRLYTVCKHISLPLLLAPGRGRIELSGQDTGKNCCLNVCSI